MQASRQDVLNWYGLGMKDAKITLRHLVAGAALAVLILSAVGCGDPTAELLEGSATRVASGEEAPLAFEAELCVGGARIRVLVADTQSERAAGLSGYAGLPENAGMLFVFPEPQRPTFWMKGMQFAIDIIWIRDGTVVQIHDSVAPPANGATDDQLPRYQPSQPITHVLELTAGSVDSLGITIGSRVEFCPEVSPTPNSGN